MPAAEKDTERTKHRRVRAGNDAWRAAETQRREHLRSGLAALLLAAVAFDVWNKRRTASAGGAGAEKEATAPPPPELLDEMEHREGADPPSGAGAGTRGT